MIMRTRLRLPSTTLGTLRSMHFLLQAPQVPQGVTSQSTGQLVIPHSWCWLSTTLGTLRSMHFLLQAPQVPQGVTSQSTGQLVIPHSWCWLSRPHGLPPYFAEVSSWRKRLWIPTPHERVHWLQEPHSD